MPFLGINIVIASGLVGLIRTGILLRIQIIGSSLKIVVGVVLVLLGFGWWVLGYAMVYITLIILGTLYLIKLIGFTLSFDINVVKRVVKAGVVSWIPSMVAGQLFGVVAVYGFRDAVETSHYYIALMISLLVTFIDGSLAQLLLPALSGMVDGRKRAAAWVLRVGLAAMTPVMVFVLFYPWPP